MCSAYTALEGLHGSGHIGGFYLHGYGGIIPSCNKRRENGPVIDCTLSKGKVKIILDAGSSMVVMHMYMLDPVHAVLDEPV